MKAGMYLAGVIDSPDRASADRGAQRREMQALRAAVAQGRIAQALT